MSIPTRATLTALAVLLLAVVPSSASASTAAVTAVPGDPAFDVVSYQAATGEANDVSVRSVTGEWILQDPGAVVIPGESCVSLDPHTVQCRPRPQRPLELIRVELGDGDDAATWVPPIAVGNVVLSGGSGDDRLSVPAAEDGAAANLLGGQGNDRLDGGAGRYKVLSGEEGNDRIAGGTSGYADMRGGTGDDVLRGTPGADDLRGGVGSTGCSAATGPTV